MFGRRVASPAIRAVERLRTTRNRLASLNVDTSGLPLKRFTTDLDIHWPDFAMRRNFRFIGHSLLFLCGNRRRHADTSHGVTSIAATAYSLAHRRSPLAVPAC